METFSVLLVHTPVTGEFPLQEPVTRIFEVFFDLRPNKRSSKESWGWWFGTPLRSLWCYCNVNRSTDRYGSAFSQNEVHIWYGPPILNRCDPVKSYGDQGWGQFNSGIGIAAQFQFQFRNWNWNWNYWNWKWNWNWKPWNWNWNWNWKPELNFLQLLLQQLPVNQPFPNFSFNRGHNLSCDWLFMQQVFLGHPLPPLWCGHKRYMGMVPCSPWVDRGQKD